ncbi:hypothetical protein SynBIOSU31_01623 [Synechococcus sp. BIOS-U3-1]|nr:hypothetical protein SynBIOSU31_01623 [Synechococcus sp. BIOS-U3-1]
MPSWPKRAHHRVIEIAWRFFLWRLSLELEPFQAASHQSRVSHRIPALVLIGVSVGAFATEFVRPVEAYVPLMAGQRARPLNGSFNNVPVLHSNQPEIVKGPGILVNTSPGSSIAAETNQPLRNSTFAFNGEFGVHMHHKYYPQDSSKLGGRRARGLLTVAAIAINPSSKPVTLRFKRGSVKNSFEAPYHPNKLMGVKPLGPRPWNTGPGDATAVQILRGELDRKLSREIIIPPNSRKVIVSTILPARGIMNGLLRGTSDGPFHMAVIAAEETQDESALIAVLDRGQLAPGRIYLNRIREIQSGQVFSRVAGVALGDEYKASIQHDLSQGALHVPLTSTRKHHFGTRDIQVNQLSTRMVDSAVNNIGTYGVRFDVELNLAGEGAHELVLSHPVASGRSQFTAFRGSIGIRTDQGYQEVHVGMRSGQSLSIADLDLKRGAVNPVMVSVVYPADATPGHLLSVVPVTQLAMLRERQQMLEAARKAQAEAKTRQVKPEVAPPAVHAQPVPGVRPAALVAKPVQKPARTTATPPPPVLVSPRGGTNAMPPAMIMPSRVNSSLEQRYRDAIRAQQEWLRRLQGR